MIIVRLKGGLGNQMFQYALGRVLSLKYKTDLGLDCTFLLDRTPASNFTFRDYVLDDFNINARVVAKNEIPFLYRTYRLGFLMRCMSYLHHKIFCARGSEKKEFLFDPTVFSIGSSAYVDGYWQSYKYFQDYADTIRNDFTLRQEPSTHIQALAREVRACNSVCVHVRRGDYVGNPHHEVVTRDYYAQGMKMLSGLTAIDTVYVFSDDILWCKEHISFDVPTVFVDETYKGVHDEGHMYLMSLCQSFIIANSSFSWWGAWLSSRTSKHVICPKVWMPNSSIITDDLVPPEWIRI